MARHGAWNIGHGRCRPPMASVSRLTSGDSLCSNPHSQDTVDVLHRHHELTIRLGLDLNFSRALRGPVPVRGRLGPPTSRQEGLVLRNRVLGKWENVPRDFSQSAAADFAFSIDDSELNSIGYDSEGKGKPSENRVGPSSCSCYSFESRQCRHSVGWCPQSTSAKFTLALIASSTSHARDESSVGRSHLNGTYAQVHVSIKYNQDDSPSGRCPRSAKSVMHIRPAPRKLWSLPPIDATVIYSLIELRTGSIVVFRRSVERERWQGPMMQTVDFSETRLPPTMRITKRYETSCLSALWARIDIVKVSQSCADFGIGFVGSAEAKGHWLV